MSLTLERQNAYRDRYRQMRPGWEPATRVYEQAIRSSLRRGMVVVDVGCGRGGVFEQLQNESHDLALYTVGVDPDLASLREHRLPALPRAEALAGALPFHNASVDLFLSSWVFEHLADPHLVFAELGRILKPGGRIIFLTPNALSAVALLNRTLRPLQRWLVPRLYGRAEADTFRVTYRANTGRQIRRLAEQAGLRVERLLHIEDPTYLAFNTLFFRLSVGLSRITPPVHLIGILSRSS